MNDCKIANHEMYSLSRTGQVHSGKMDMQLTPREQPNGYLVVTLDGEQLLLHRLVAKHFIPNPYDHPQVNHINGNKKDNRVENLEWVSAKGNVDHALRTGLRKGFVHVDTRRELIRRVLQGALVADLAEEVGNHPNTLSKMLREQAKKDGLGKEWRDAMAVRRKLAAVKNLEKANVANKPN